MLLYGINQTSIGLHILTCFKWEL